MTGWGPARAGKSTGAGVVGAVAGGGGGGGVVAGTASYARKGGLSAGDSK